MHWFIYFFHFLFFSFLFFSFLFFYSPPPPRFHCNPGWQQQILRWRLKHFFFFLFFFFPRPALVGQRVAGREGRRKRRGGGGGEKKRKESRRGLRLLYCGGIIPDEPIRLVVSLNCGFFFFGFFFYFARGRYSQPRMYSSGSIKAPNITAPLMPGK